MLMRILKWFSFTLLLLMACRPASEEERIAKKFLHHLSRGDYEKARNYVVSSSLTVLYDFQNIGIFPDSLQAHPISWKIDSISHYTSDSARVYFIWNGLPEEMNLVKEKGNWKVIF
jgi:hypothetical protein